jgi:hypothetical protein
VVETVDKNGMTTRETITLKMPGKKETNAAIIKQLGSLCKTDVSSLIREMKGN